MTGSRPPAAEASQPGPLVLSLFPGIDLLGRGFEAEGFCVVRGPDLLWGGDVRSFRPPAERFDGVIGGPPCQDFSRKRRAPRGGQGVAMLRQFLRCVLEARPAWFVMENVPGVPQVEAPGYAVQKFNLNAAECGGRQRRLRVFFFGFLDGSRLVIDRLQPRGALAETCLASEGQTRARRGWREFCQLQGVGPLELPGLSIAAKYRAVGNAVPVYMARVIARAVHQRRQLINPWHGRGESLCECGCGRLVEGRQRLALPACRKREQRRRDLAAAGGGVRISADS